MSFTAGTRIGPYEITSPLGEGGMGVVYRAHDTKLGRDVAIKALPDAFANDSDRLQRFQREAQVLASLNHPNIAHIYGLEESDKASCIVMELVEGETLQERLRRGAIPVDEALGIAKQIAEALEAAHEKGIIHRDLKPANIKVSSDGKVKVLDFGLAKAFQEQRVTTLSNSPTLLNASMPGVILGTAAYMSPEQARGRDVDRTGDVWAFGCVLYEMLTGRPAFEGEDVTEILGRIVTTEPDWSRLLAGTPSPIQRLLKRSLRKDPRQRLGDLRDARLEIEEALTVPVLETAPTDALPRGASNRPLWIALAVAVLVAVGFAVVHLREVPPASQTYEFQIAPPPNTRLSTFRVSPDGRAIAFIATGGAVGGGEGSLWIRMLDSLESHPVPGAEGSSYPFWSPDSAFVGYFQGGKLKRVPMKGGPSQTICDVVTSRGGTWGPDGTILFADGPTSPILKVPASSGKPIQLTQLAKGDVALGHRFPEFLPDGHHFLFMVYASKPENSGIFVGALDGSAPKRILPDTSNATYVPDTSGRGGHLFFLREGTLLAVPFDVGALRVTGEAFPVSENIAPAANVFYGAFSSSAVGSLAFWSGSRIGSRELVWMDRTGKLIGTVGMPEQYGASFDLSPDEKTLAVTQGVSPQTDIWLIDLNRINKTRFTFGYGGQNPQWTPDGASIIYSHLTGAASDIVRKPVTGGTEDVLARALVNGFTTDVSPNGKQIVHQMSAAKSGYDIGIISVDGNHQASVYLGTPANELSAHFSPDGKWMAYMSNESGRYEVYLQTIPAGGRKYQISTTGGSLPVWRRDGRELFYLSLDQKIMSVPLGINGATLDPGTPQELFSVPGATAFTITRDAQRFLVNIPAGGEVAVSPPITVLTNWQAALKK
jgi:serine/threonine protein kinase/Tol biopolymer transport system component